MGNKELLEKEVSLFIPCISVQNTDHRGAVLSND